MSLTELAHVRNEFDFTLGAGRDRVAPLFGANKERVWAGDWDPCFLHPQPAADQAGAVFSVEHGPHRSIWITTVFKPEEGHIQHAYFLPDVMVTLIDIHLDQPDPFSTRVRVTYERTALSAAQNGRVRAQGEADAGYAEHWKREIDAYLATSPGPL